MATIKDIADKLGISISTVSKGLNGAADVSESLRRSILETAVELGYKNSRSQKKDTRKMAVFVENINYESPDSFGHDIIMGFKKAAFRDHWGVTVIPLTAALQEENKYDSYMMQGKYSGAFFIGLSLSDPWLEEFRSTSIPTVLFDNVVAANPSVSSISTDCEEAFDMTVGHLIALRHEKIAFLNGSAGSFISDQRMSAFLHSMAKHSLKADPNLAVYGWYNADCARYHVPALLARGATAILCGNDLIASGVIDCCKEAGYSVPEDVSVIGFDDLPVAAELDPPLTTIHQNRLQIGKCGFYTLHAMIDHVPLSKNMLRPVLVERGSTAIAKPRLAESALPDKDSILFVNPDLYARFS